MYSWGYNTSEIRRTRYRSEDSPVTRTLATFSSANDLINPTVWRSYRRWMTAAALIGVVAWIMLCATIQFNVASQSAAPSQPPSGDVTDRAAHAGVDLDQVPPMLGCDVPALIGVQIASAPSNWCCLSHLPRPRACGSHSPIFMAAG